MRKIGLLLAISLLCVNMALAQKKVTGVVIDNMGSAVPGVTVSEKGSVGSMTITDILGVYEITVSSDTAVLIFEFLGMKSVELPVEGRDVLPDVVMQESLTGLDEVVVIGYGSSKKSNISTSISNVSGMEQINSRPISSASDFIQGNVPGVTVIQQGGDPTSSPEVVIRGIGSINNESPLWVVDGVACDNPSLLNPNDIESISILKDAAAAAIYGAQASSGVIVVTTKNAKAGKQNVTFNLIYGVKSASNLPTPLNAKQQSEAYNIATDNSGVARLPAHDASKNPWGTTTRTNWVDEIFRSAKFLNANLSISGGNDKGNYFTSFGYKDIEGVLLGTNSKLYTARLKSAYNITDKITIGENFMLAHNNAVGANTSSSYSGVIMNAIWMPSAAPVYEADGSTFHGVAPIGSKFAGSYGDVYNPVALLLRPTTNAPQTSLNGNGYVTYKPIRGLTLKS